MSSAPKTSREASSQSVDEWQIEQIKAGIAEADRGEFATDEEMEEVLKRWKIPRAQQNSPNP
jgi:predicted transcriptional regulator